MACSFYFFGESCQVGGTTRPFPQLLGVAGKAPHQAPGWPHSPAQPWAKEVAFSPVLSLNSIKPKS